jgi:deoxyguanosine kinase
MLETTAYIGLGSNLGEREGFIKKALAMLDETQDLTVCRVSKVIETLPLSWIEQPEYLNTVAEIKTGMNARRLLERLQRIEKALGRERQEVMSSRTIDLDLLLFGQKIINESDLIVPHACMHLRSFVLKGLAELNPDFVHPVLKHTVGELVSRLNGRDYIINPNVPQLVSMAGIIGVGKTTLAKGLAENLGAQLLLEAYDTNPFLAKVYAGQKELALDSQLHFLASRAEQIGVGTLNDGQIAVSDYVFDKEKIYAKRLLDPAQHSLYSKINKTFAEKINPPVLLIYLKDTAQNCLDRIHKRNRPYEQRISLEFLQIQYDDYEELVAEWTQCPVITVAISEFDCRDAAKIAKLTQEVKAYIAIKLDEAD